VLSGHVNVSRGEAQVATLFAGEHIGEMSLIREQPRSARAVAGEHVEGLAILRDDLWALLRSEPVIGTKLLWRLACGLADRLDQTTGELHEFREKLAAPDLSHEVFYDDDDDVRDTLRPPSFLPGPG
jgi:CRP-like cAMP-binding protein